MHDEVYPNIYNIIYISLTDYYVFFPYSGGIYALHTFKKGEKEEVIKPFESLKAFYKLAVIIIMMIY